MAQETSSTRSPTEIVTSIWFGLAAIRRHPGGQRRLRLRWLRVFCTFVGLGLVTWMMAALGLYFWWKLYRGYQDERFSDVLFLMVPANMQKHERAMGEYFIRLADDHLAHHRFDLAMKAYTIGVGDVKDNLHAREVLSEFFYIYYKDTLENSLKVLEDGLPYAIVGDPVKDPETFKEHYRYINQYLSKLQQAHMPKKVEEICQQYLAQKPANQQIRELFALNLASVYIDDGNFDGAEDTLKNYQLEATLDGVMLNSRLLWERGRLYDAPKYLEKALPRFNAPPANLYIYGLLSRYYRDLGDLDHSEYYIRLRVVADMTNAMPRIELLYIAAKSGDKAKVLMDVQNLREQFHDNASAMTMIASFATDQGDEKLAADIFQQAQEEYKKDIKTKGKSDFYLPSFALLLCEAYLTNDHYQEALQYLDSLNEEKPDWLEPNILLFDAMRAIADYGIRDLVDADVNLTKLIKSDKTRPDTLLTIANRFLSHGALDQAQRLLAAAHHMDPHNQAILAQLISANLQLGNSAEMSQNLRDLLKTRRPPLELLYDAYHELGSDRFIFVPDREALLEQIDQQIRESVRMRTPEDAA